MRIVILLLGAVLAGAVAIHEVTVEGVGEAREGVEEGESAGRRVVKLSPQKYLELLRVEGNPDYAHSSGHYCVDAVLNYYFRAHALPLASSPHLLDPIDLDSRNFTSPEHLVRAVQRVLNSGEMAQFSRAFGIILQENSDGALLERCIDQEMPVVLLLQGWYGVVVGYDQEHYYLLDPARPHALAALPKPQLPLLAHVPIPSQHRIASQAALILTYRSPSPSPHPHPHPRLRPTPAPSP